MKKLIVANWKMYPTLSDSLVLSSHYHQELSDIKNTDVVIAPPTPWLVSLIESHKHWPAHVKFAAQNIYPADQGAYTGEISAYMLKSMVDYAIIGHSERRLYQAEDDELINDKVQACLKWRIRPIICVGEKKHHEGSEADRVGIVEQLSAALKGVDRDNLSKVVVAYEPIWAIGTGRNASPAYVVSVINHLKRQMATKFGPSAADITYLYGGSVNGDNAAAYLSEPMIGGLLVGQVSTKAREFIRICSIATGLK